MAQPHPPDGRDHAPWPLLDSLGYGVAGLGLGILAATSSESSGFFPSGGQLGTIALGALGGVGLGWKIGGGAVEKSSQGRLGFGHRLTAAAGPVLLGAGLGALAAVPAISGDETDTRFGSDEDTVRLFSLVGAALGALTAMLLWGDLDPSGVAVTPAVLEGGAVGLQLSSGF